MAAVQGRPLPGTPYAYSPINPPVQYTILGTDAQCIQFILQPNERVAAELDALMYMSNNIQLQTSSKGCCGRLCSGESLFLNHFRCLGPSQGYVGLTCHDTSSKIIPVQISSSNPILAQPGAYLCSIGNVQVSSERVKGLRCMVMQLFWQKIWGEGIVFLSAKGGVVRKTLSPGESIVVDWKCIIAKDASVNMKLGLAGNNLNSSLMGSEGLFLVTMTQPSTATTTASVYLQTMSRSLSSRPPKRSALKTLLIFLILASLELLVCAILLYLLQDFRYLA